MCASPQAAGDSVSTKFDVAGTYGYYCEPHQGAGCAPRSLAARTHAPERHISCSHRTTHRVR